MKTLKKALCLVLAVVMCLGLATVAFAGNFDKYTDVADMGDAYKEATDVMVGTGIIAGTSATTLSPTATYTRAEAAKIITFMKVGPTSAEALVATAQIFNDVPVTHWAAGYITYCYNEGIIAGNGMGGFNPDSVLSGYAWGKMLLCSVGYGVNKEYNNDNWQIAVAKDAIPLGVYSGDVAGASAAGLQRQQAILYAFNTFTKAEKVSYSALLGTYTNSQIMTGTLTGGTTLASSVYALYNTADDVLATVGGITYKRGEAEVSSTYYVGDVKATAGTPDQIHRFGHIWYQVVAGKKVPVSNIYLADTTLGTSKTEFEAKTITYLSTSTNAGKGYIADLDADVEVYVDNLDAAASLVKYPNIKNYNWPVGTKITFVSTDTDAKAEIVLVQTENSYVVTAAPFTTGAGDAMTATIPGVNPVTNLNAKKVSYPELAKGDIANVQVMADGKTYVTKAEVKTGTFAALTRTYVPNDTITVGTDKYVKGNDNMINAATGFVPADAIIESYLSLNGSYYFGTEGFVVCAKFDTTPVYDLALVEAVDAGNVSTAAKLLFADGTELAVSVKKVTLATGVAAGALTGGDIVNYHKTDAGYELKIVARQAMISASHSVDYYYGTAYLMDVDSTDPQNIAYTVRDNTIIDNKTIAFVKVGTTYKAYVGIGNIPSITGSSAGAISAYNKVNPVKELYAFYLDATSVLPGTNNEIYGSVQYVTATPDGKGGATYTPHILINGTEAVDLPLTDGGTTIMAGDFVRFSKSVDGKTITLVGDPADYTANSGIVVRQRTTPVNAVLDYLTPASSGSVDFGGDQYTLAADTKYFYVSDTGDSVTEGPLAATGVAGSYAQNKLAYCVFNTNGTVKQIWYFNSKLNPYTLTVTNTYTPGVAITVSNATPAAGETVTVKFTRAIGGVTAGDTVTVTYDTMVPATAVTVAGTATMTWNAAKTLLTIAAGTTTVVEVATLTFVMPAADAEITFAD